MQTRYPISNLYTDSLNLNALLEIVTDDYGNKAYVNKKITVESFFDFLVSSHAIFNKIDDVFNDRSVVDIKEETNEKVYRYATSAYISGQTYFNNNPRANNETFFEDLKINETVKKQQLEKYIHDKCLEVRSLMTEDTAVQYTENGWYKSLNDEENPRIDILSFVKFAKPNANCSINKSPTTAIPFWHSGPIAIYSNSFATIFGKIKVDGWTEMSTSPYFTPEAGRWVGIMSECDNGGTTSINMIAMSELHNFSEDRSTAYFSFQLPMGCDTNYYVVLPFQPPEAETTRESRAPRTSYKLFQITDDIVYVLVDDSILRSYPRDQIPEEILEALAVEEESEDIGDTYDMFSKIPLNSAAVLYYSETAKDGGEIALRWEE